MKNIVSIVINYGYIFNGKDLLLFVNKFLEHISISNNKI